MIDATTYQNIVSTYISLNSRVIFSSVIRERNKALLDSQENNVPASKMAPYLPFVLLINPDSISYQGIKPTVGQVNSIDGLILNFTPNYEFGTITLSGNSGDLFLVYSQLRSGLSLFNQSLPPNFQQYVSNNSAIDLTATNANNLLADFYNFMSSITNTYSIKQTTMYNLKAFVEEPNIINDGNQIFTNFKRITIFSALYPLGKTYWGVLESPLQLTQAAESYRNATFSLTFKIIKENRPDLVPDPFQTDGTIQNIPNGTLQSVTPQKQPINDPFSVPQTIIQTPPIPHPSQASITSGTNVSTVGQPNSTATKKNPPSPISNVNGNTIQSSLLAGGTPVSNGIAPPAPSEALNKAVNSVTFIDDFANRNPNSTTLSTQTYDAPTIVLLLNTWTQNYRNATNQPQSQPPEIEKVISDPSGGNTVPIMAKINIDDNTIPRGQNGTNASLDIYFHIDRPSAANSFMWVITPRSIEDIKL